MPEAPRLSPPRVAERGAGYPGDLGAAELVDGLRFTGEWSELDLTEAVLDDCHLDGVTIDGCELRGIRISASHIVDLGAPALAAPRSEWREVTVERSRIGAAELFDAELRDVRVQGSRLGYLNLRGATLLDVLFDGCRIDELDLARVTARRVAFRGCTIGTLDVRGATLADVDLRGADLHVVNGVDGLRGATIDAVQLQLFAPLLAVNLGIDVDDAE